jgi:hypothetical protein
VVIGPLHGQDGDGSGDGADPGHPVQHAVAAVADGQEGRRDPWRDGKRKSAGHVEHAEILGGAVLVRQHVDNEGEVDGHVYAEAESADGHADEKTVEVAGDGDHEQRHAVHDRRGEHEDFPPARPVGKCAADEGRGDDDDGLHEGA